MALPKRLEKLSKIDESVDSKTVPETPFIIYKKDVQVFSKNIKKYLESVSDNFVSLSNETKALVKKDAINVKNTVSNLNSLQKSFNSRATNCKKRATILSNSINKSAEDLESRLVKASKSWEDYQVNFKKYQL